MDTDLLLFLVVLTAGPVLIALLTSWIGYSIGYRRGHRDGQIEAERLERFTEPSPGRCRR